MNGLELGWCESYLVTRSLVYEGSVFQAVLGDPGDCAVCCSGFDAAAPEICAVEADFNFCPGQLFPFMEGVRSQGPDVWNVRHDCGALGSGTESRQAPLPLIL